MTHLSLPRIRIGSYSLCFSSSGCTRSSGLPFTLISPLPGLQTATAVAFFFLPKVWTTFFSVLFLASLHCWRSSEWQTVMRRFRWRDELRMMADCWWQTVVDEHWRERENSISCRSVWVWKTSKRRQEHKTSACGEWESTKRPILRTIHLLHHFDEL